MPTKKITRRWLYNSFLVILIFLSLIIIAFSLAIRSYYYNSVLTVVRNTASVQNASLVNYSEDNTVDFSASVRTLVENFADKDRMELMAIDKNGTVIITSSGFSPSGDLEMPDYEAALSSSTRDAYSYDTLNGESVLAYTLLAPSVDDSNVSALRYVVSLTAVKRQIYMLIAAAGVVGAAIIFFVILSNSYFINSVINPIDEVRKIALQISKGDFSTHLKKTSDDEIGELCDAINAMALELQENEKMKNDFISSVSHELRTPLTAIKGWAETLMDDSVDRETTKKGIGVIIKESDRLSGMVEELLDFSRLQSGRLKLSLTKIDLVAELSDAVLMFTERARQEGIALNYGADGHPAHHGRLQPAAPGVCQHSGQRLKIFRRGRQRHRHGAAQRKQRDHSDPRHRHRHRLGGPAQGQDPLLQGQRHPARLDEIVSMHGGNLSLDSQEGEGTTVTISLPLAC